MKVTTKLYLKSFFIYGIIFGLIMTLWEYIDEEKINLWRQVFQGVFFGGFMSWATVTAHKRAMRKYGKNELTEEDFKVSQCDYIIKENSIQEIYDLMNHHEAINKWKIEIKGSNVIGKTKTSWSSWGEKIIISDLGENIKIESKPVLKTTMFDNGKNRENVLLIKELIGKG
ncbi:hypothetical protein [Marinifilum sp. D737]|uniref:hypothetical protein n=1 Tax=Marinifilum sp. D737 TaxID=2969628 RepID=UPI002275B1E3|nr:hypothetical protein [Marinifilum sp. D737]MCY1636499.1 hypothetical protein [Marinifilum sp. D737]